MDNDNELHVVEYKETFKGEVLLGYYRGFPLSCFKTVEGRSYGFSGNCSQEDRFLEYVTRSRNEDLMKEQIAEVIKKFQRWVDYRIDRKTQEDTTAKQMTELFKDVIEGKYVPKQKPIENKQQEKKSWLSRLTNS